MSHLVDNLKFNTFKVALEVLVDFKVFILGLLNLAIYLVNIGEISWKDIVLLVGWVWSTSQDNIVEFCLILLNLSWECWLLLRLFLDNLFALFVLLALFNLGVLNNANVLALLLLLFDLLEGLLVKLKLEVDLLLVTDVWFSCIRPDVLVESVVRVFTDVVVNDDALEGMGEV